MSYPKDSRGYVLTEYKEDALKEVVLGCFAAGIDTLTDQVFEFSRNVSSAIEDAIPDRKREIELEHDGEDISEDEWTEIFDDDDELIRLKRLLESYDEWIGEFSRIADFDDFRSVMDNLDDDIFAEARSISALTTPLIPDWLEGLLKLDSDVADNPSLAKGFLLDEEIAALESGSWRISDDGIEAF
ncbi:MAG: hypothetical protein LKI30_03975 [Bifidobacterium crudilactis]|jgi:hypothetical protein|nr:hypothetical protein [Bifidobacterium crudilactis]